jgi:hypothetical protein
MSMPGSKVYRRDYTTVVVQRYALIAIIVAAFLLAVVHAYSPIFGRAWLQEVAVAILLVALGTGTLTVLWELGVRRTFFAELLEAIDERIRVSESVTSHRLIQVTNDFFGAIDWERLITEARQIDLYWWAGRTWLKHNADLLRKKAEQDKKFRLRLVLPDTRDSRILERMAADSGIGGDTLRAAVEEAKETVRALVGAKAEVLASPRVPRYPFMRLGGVVVLGTYSNWVGLNDQRPTFLFPSESDIGGAAMREFSEVAKRADPFP